MKSLFKQYCEKLLKENEVADDNAPRRCLLKLSAGQTLNREDGGKIPHWSFSLPSGFSCPFAKSCLSKANRETGKIKDGPMTDFRCFSASQEATFTNTRKQRWNNMDALRAVGLNNVEAMANLIISSIESQLPRSQKVFRIHVGGDFFNENYFQAWKIVAKAFPDIIFYAYTKSIPYVLDNLPLPDNFRITASRGSEYDDLIDKHNLKYAKVVFSEKEAEDLGLEIDHDDSHAWKDDKPFALLLHGVQPKGSKAAEALKALGGIGGKSSYGKKGAEARRLASQTVEPKAPEVASV